MYRGCRGWGPGWGRSTSDPRDRRRRKQRRATSGNNPRSKLCRRQSWREQNVLRYRGWDRRWGRSRSDRQDRGSKWLRPGGMRSEATSKRLLVMGVKGC